MNVEKKYNEDLVEAKTTANVGGSSNAMYDKYQNIANGQTAGVEQSSTNKPNGSTDYYTLAKQQEYGKLLDSEVQLENAKANALKYTQNQINAAGLGGSGVGSSMQGSTYNKYLSLLGNVKNDYANTIKTLDYQQAQEQQAQADDRFQSITTMISTADDLDSLNNMLADYGVGSYDNEGNFTLSSTKPEGMSDDDWYQMKYYYNLQKKAIEQYTNTSGTYTSLDQLKAYTSSLSGTTDNEGNMVQSYDAEMNTLWQKGYGGQIANNGVVKVTNGEGNTIYIKYTSKGFVASNEEEYNNSQNQYNLNRIDTGKGKNNYNEWVVVK